MLAVGRVLCGLADFGESLDLLVTTGQILEATFEFRLSALLLEVILVLSALSVGSGRLLLSRCWRIAFFRFAKLSFDPLLLAELRLSPFAVDTADFDRHPRRIREIAALERAFGADFSEFGFVYGLCVDAPEERSNDVMMQFCVQIIDASGRQPANEQYRALEQFVRYLGVKRNWGCERQIATLAQMNEAVPVLQAQANAVYLQEIAAAIADLADLLAECRRKTVVDFQAVQLACESLERRISDGETQRFACEMHREANWTRKRHSRELCALLVPAKLTYADQWNRCELFHIDAPPRETEIGTVLYRAEATFWEFAESAKVTFELTDSHFFISQETVLLSVKLGSVDFVLTRKMSAIEIFAMGIGSIYVDFAPETNKAVMDALVGVDPRFAANLDAVLFSKPVTNFEYLVALNLLAGATFHVENQQPLLPYGDFEGELRAEEFFIPELLGKPLSSAYELRKVLERLRVDEYALAKFSDLVRARIPHPAADPITDVTIRDLSFGDSEEIESAAFFEDDFLYLQLESGRYRFVRFSDQPQAISLQKSTISGVAVPTSGGLFVISEHRFIQQITPLAVSPPCDLRCAVDFMKVIDHDIFFVSQQCCLYTSQSETPEQSVRILVSSGRICAFDVSKTFGAIVVGTEKCILSVHSLTTHELTALIDLNGIEPDKLIITPSWGLIVVVVHKEIIVFSINGGFVGKVAIESEIREWRSFSDENGFDYVLLWDVGNRIRFFEAMKPEEMACIPARNSSLIAIQYLKTRKCIAGLSKEGIVTMYPFRA
jgi:hypothetical protein